MRAAELFAGAGVLSLCSGIGGLELGIEQATGARTICQVERDPFARAILARHWPGVKRMNDVRDVDSTFRGVADIVCGGFPCQPHSLAGSRKAGDDDRDLWPEMARIMREVQPKAAVFENVPGLLTSRTDPKNDATKGHFFLRILRDLEAAGYMVRWDCCPASAVGALHRRDRVFIVATRGPAGWPAMSMLPIAPESMWGHPQPLEWPRAGAWSGGSAYLARPRWPVPGAIADFNTPCRKDGEKSFSEGECKRDSLTGQIGRMIPTPQATESRNFTSGRRKPDSAHHGGVTIYDFVRMWPTPLSRDHRSGKSNDDYDAEKARPLSEVVWHESGKPESGALNPDWVEWLMGFPVGWTEIEGPSMRGADPLPLHTEPAIPRVTTRKNDRRLRLCRLGNAVVPQVARTVAEAML